MSQRELIKTECCDRVRPGYLRFVAKAMFYKAWTPGEKHEFAQAPSSELVPMFAALARVREPPSKKRGVNS